MKFYVSSFGGLHSRCCELTADSLESGPMNRNETLNMVVELLSTVEDMLTVLGNDELVRLCTELRKGVK